MRQTLMSRQRSRGSPGWIHGLARSLLTPGFRCGTVSVSLLFFSFIIAVVRNKSSDARNLLAFQILLRF